MKTTNDIDPNRHIIGLDTTVRDALERLNTLSGECMTLFATDTGGRLQGTLTDGDVRRGLLAGATLDSPLAEVMHRDFHAILPGTDAYVTVAEARERGIMLLPCLDAEGSITRILDLRRLKALVPADAVLMAGGRGERLRPLTLDTPKPLLKIAGKAIIDYNVDNLHSYGINNIFVTTGYLAEQIEEHFRLRGDGVRCVREPHRLGTMGSLALIEGLRAENVIVMNSDLLTDIDFEALYRTHMQSGAALTMAAVPYNVSVPFAILQTRDDNTVAGLAEKPVYNYFANAGVYIMNSGLIADIKRGEYLDAPDFIDSLIARGLKIGYYTITGTWIDIGSPDDFRYADKMMSQRFSAPSK